MAIEPRLPIPSDDATAYERALHYRLDELLRDLLRPIDYETGSITIATGNTTATATLKKKARYVAMTGIYFNAIGGANSAVAKLALTNNITVSATRANTVGDTVISYIAIP